MGNIEKKVKYLGIDIIILESSKSFVETAYNISKYINIDLSGNSSLFELRILQP
jgi:hypothetical protein